MRKYGMENPYELLKEMTRGKDQVIIFIKRYIKS